jgi:hypothetical protein
MLTTVTFAAQIVSLYWTKSVSLALWAEPRSTGFPLFQLNTGHRATLFALAAQQLSQKDAARFLRTEPPIPPAAK